MQHPSDRRDPPPDGGADNHRFSATTGPRDLHDATRIADANANRLNEALRTIEDFARYALDDRLLTNALKGLRHELNERLPNSLPTRQRLAARDTASDVGTTLSTNSEFHRGDLQAAVVANFQRAQQAARSLEEALKLIETRNDLSNDGSYVVEQSRYQLYDLESALVRRCDCRARLASTVIYALIDAQPTSEAFETYVTRLIEAGVDAIQLRDKRLADRELLERCCRLRSLTTDTEVLAIINDRADLAALARLDGVHVGQDDLEIRDVRRIVGHECLIGVSTHNPADVERAVLGGADYLGFGPMFESTTKSFERFVGVDQLREVVSSTSIPLFAIGGLGLNNVPQVAETGCGRVAVGSAIAAEKESLVDIVRDLKLALTASSAAP